MGSRDYERILEDLRKFKERVLNDDNLTEKEVYHFTLVVLEKQLEATYRTAEAIGEIKRDMDHIDETLGVKYYRMMLFMLGMIGLLAGLRVLSIVQLIP